MKTILLPNCSFCMYQALCGTFTRPWHCRSQLCRILLRQLNAYYLHQAYFQKTSGFCVLQQSAMTNASLPSGSSPRSSKQNSAMAPRPILTITQRSQELNSMSVSPDGTKIASTSKTGILYINDSSTGQLLGGFKVYSGSCFLSVLLHAIWYLLACCLLWWLGHTSRHSCRDNKQKKSLVW